MDNERRAVGMDILVAGGSGVVGREAVRELVARGHRVRVLSRASRAGARAGARVPEGVQVIQGDVLRPETLRGACDGAEVVVSAVGGSLDIRKIRERTSYDRVDHLGNRALLEEAERAVVRRFVYVSVFSTPATDGLEYVAAHLRFEDALRASRLERGVVRPTGVFAFFLEVLGLVRKGRAVVLGDGSARTNPVHEADVGRAVADAAESTDRVVEKNVGGPDVLTRREIAEAAFRAVGREPRITSAPPGALRAAAGVFVPFNPRLAALLRFGTEVSLSDCVAPSIGTRRLEEYFGLHVSSGAW